MGSKYISVQLILVRGRVPLEVMMWAKAQSGEVQSITGYVTGIVPECHSVILRDPWVVLEQRRAVFRAVVSKYNSISLGFNYHSTPTSLCL